MLRKIVFVLVLLAFAAGLGWFFLQYEEAKASMNDALIAIPSDAALTNQRVFLEFGEEDGVPDGAAIDSEGCYWLLRRGPEKLGDTRLLESSTR